MNKQELVEKVAEKSGISKSQSAKTINAVLETITEELVNGGCVNLIGFGNFKVTDRKSRPGRNPTTGEVIEIPAAKVPRFTPGKALKDSVKK
ncbi:HU family DNA-binding protein [Parasutterella muris]|uniref:DNA-binding protein n=1 Tax=Parasutterella muris TaxID=2565572 RepID=A0A6L6YJC7_9BURK|nr:HU family DNA-binding protein [Parasutterella muris]MVX57786.1 DNA-binding protein [Parasutterella muris]